MVLYRGALAVPRALAAAAWKPSASIALQLIDEEFLRRVYMSLSANLVRVGVACVSIFVLLFAMGQWEPQKRMNEWHSWCSHRAFTTT